ncbi:centrosomal protein of 170 kDa protein B isoform X2 [Gymnodraco acuticeps]|uniref:Centrosomal protein of 170 kDa protein B isoform X2 n=1 Tax=Gymnodraco acuticeps TaxID=8218 RepID=A0A6P8VPW7_GYMAC|nr:centrosomal protein of 170 kDa protein B isoform X2 [Gymnodraco acuticeps]
MSVTSWFLVSSSGTRHRLPREMIFVGRDDCELMLQSRSVDKQHAVINYDQNTDEHMVKDLGSLNGTFVNDLRIPDQTYITLKLSDVVRFGYDAHVYILERSQHKVPEEALKHEKYTSQLQLGIKALQAKAKEKQQLQSSEKSKSSVSKLQDKAERKAQSLTASTESPISKPTPLYGQPSWWGEDEEAASKSKNRGGKSPEQESPEPAKDVSRYEVNGSLSESQAKSILSYRREPSYFEIPTKELHQRAAKKPESQVHEVPTKDTPNPADIVSSTPPVVQSHASFTIEFDECTPGKMKIKDHVTKFSFRQQHKLPSTEHVTAPTEVISAESKVADWLVQSNASMRRKSIAEELYGTNGYSSPLRITKANHSEDDTHVESRDPAINGGDFLQSDPLSGSHVSPQPLRASPPQRLASPDSEEALSRSPPEPQSLSSLGKAEPHQAFVIEFFDEGPRKKRSQSFTNNPSPPESSCLRVPLDKVKKSSSPAVERRGPPPASTTTPTKRYTVPLKGPASTGFQRAGSLRREKTEDRMSTSYSSRSSSSVSARPFSSVGRRSKLAQEFNAEFLKQAKQAASASWEENASSPPTAAKTETVAISQSSPAPSKAPYQPQTSSPIHQPVALKAPVMAPVTQSVEVTSPTVGPKHEEEDSLSDAGTYTIEADIQDKELEEARTKIDQSPERTNQTEADSSSEFSPVLVESREQDRQSSCGEVRPAPEQGQSLVEVQAAGAVLQGAPKWMSCWASLADSYTESGPSSGLFDISSQMELSAGARGSITNNATLTRHNDSADSDGSRARRILPQVPQREKSDIPTPSIHVHYDPHSTFIVGERGLATPRFQEGLHRLSVQDDVEPDSLSDASRSDDGSIVEQKRRQPSDTEEKTKENKLSTKSTSFYIGSEESQPDRGGSNSSTEKRNGTKMFSTATLTKPKGSPDSGKIKPTLSAPVLNQSSDSEGSVSPLIRQESYTKEQPSNARLPNISILSLQRESESFQGAVNQDTHSYLKDTEDVLAALEAKLRAGQSVKTPSPVMDCVSTESDVDTSSTVSQHSNNTRSNIRTSKASASDLHRDRSSGSIASQDSSYQSTTSEKMRSLEADSNNQTGFFRRPVGLRRSVGKHGSTDLSDDPQSLPYSDQESNSYQTRKKYTVPLQKEDSKTTRTSMALSRANSLTAPRPTRASMLRRARLGEASDNEGTETDRMSQEAGNAPAKQPQETKKLSRLDMLAMPRKRAGSFNTPSDTESSSAPIRSGFSNRSTESGGSSARRASTSGLKPAEKQQKAPPNKAPLTRGRSNSAKYTGSTTSSRRRQKGSDYASTSDEEYDSNQSIPKHKRSQPSSASHSPRHQARPQPVVALRPKPRSRDSEDENNEGEAYNNWTNHSSEIARLSQDLAKDLAILAREIHDVAGDGDPTNPAEEISAPVSAVTAHEQLVHRIPEAGLNYQRVPPNAAPPREPEQSCSDPEVSSRPRARSRDEVTVDNLMLNPVSQVTMAIRENTEQLADKIKLLFQDRVDIWEEIDAKANSDNDVPVVKSANKVRDSCLSTFKLKCVPIIAYRIGSLNWTFVLQEITSILKELRRVQRQLEVINTVMEPSGQLEASRASASSSSSGVQPSRPPASRDWRTVHSASRRGGGPRPSESVRRAAVTPDDVRAGYLV